MSMVLETSGTDLVTESEQGTIGGCKMLRTVPAHDDDVVPQDTGGFFVCDNRNENVAVMFCIDSFVDVNALNIKDSPCYRCDQGQCVRDKFSKA